MIIKKSSAMVLALVMIFSLTLAGCSGSGASASPSSSQSPQTSATPAPVVISDIAVGTAASGGAWYPIGAAMSDIISTSDLGIQASVQTTGGGVENCKLVNDGDCELAITIGYLAYNAQNGVDPYPQKMENINCLFSGLSTGVMQVVVPGDSSIQSYADLKGKKVAVGPAGGGAITCLTAALEEFGVQYSDINASYVSYDEGVTMMTDKAVDAAIVYGGIPTPAIDTLEAGHKSFRLLTLTQDQQTQILEKYSYFTPVTIPADMYGTDEAVLTLGTPNIVIVNSDMPEDVVYNICEEFFTPDNLEKIKNSQPSAKGLTLEKAAKSTAIPLHPGAEKFFKEKGVL